MQFPADKNLCPDCGYSLTGLEAPSRCPECGSEAVTPDVLIIWGMQVMDVRAAVFTQLSKQAIFILGACGCGLLAGAAMLVTIVGFSRRSISVLMMPMAIIGIVLLLLSIVQHNPKRWRRTNYQLRLTPIGHGHRSGPGRVRIFPWTGRERIVIAHQPPDRLAVQLSRPFGPSSAVHTTATTEDAATILRQASAWIAAAAEKSAAAKRADA